MMFSPDPSIMPELIKRATKDCQREDCRVSHHGASTTLLNMLPSYDRNGNSIPTPDRNRLSHTFSCSTCGKSMTVQV